MPKCPVECPYCYTTTSISCTPGSTSCPNCRSTLYVDKNGIRIRTIPSSKAKKEYGA